MISVEQPQDTEKSVDRPSHSRSPLISVCIITYKRPVWLRRLLEALGRQKTADLFDYSIVVVDNDQERSAEPVVREFAQTAKAPVGYHLEFQKNLAVVRNAAMRIATGEFIGFLDDDEFPVDDWLFRMLSTLVEHNVSGVLAPVVAHFEQTPPTWIVPSGILDRPRYPTGYRLRWTETRTGNVLLKKSVLESDEDYFDPRFATHGEDMDFFKRLCAKGHKFVWCDEAIAYETVPVDRLTRKYHLRRGLVRGCLAHSHSTAKFPGLLKSAVALLLYVPSLPLLQLRGHHLFMRYLTKACDHAGRLLAGIGISMEHILQRP